MFGRAYRGDGNGAALRPMRVAAGGRALVLHLIIVLVLLATAVTAGHTPHAESYWVVLGVYAVCSIGLGLANRHKSEAGLADGEEGGRKAEWLARASTLLNAGIALYLVVEHMLAGSAAEAEDAVAAVSRLPAFLLLLQTGLTMRVSHTILFSGLVTLAWGGTILFAALVPGSGLLGPRVSLTEEIFSLLTFLAASLVVIDGTRRLRSAVATALRVEREKAVLARFVPGKVAADLAREGGLGTARARHACLFALDIRGFSAFTREHDRDAVVRALLDIRALTQAAVSEEGGIVDKYVGDAILALFVSGRPEDQARAALRSARTIARRLQDLNRDREGAGLPALAIIVALHAGDVLVGVFDDGFRAEFTVLGTAMNQLARIESRAKAAGLELALSETFARLLGDPLGESLRLRPVREGIASAEALPLLTLD
ncbi:adenylate/guanylate cyclase domain-containing protein [Methylobacterium durans]|uniref:adenylate/guanylate cyclase domain-containing protein n=1 Tax=Methylobacterium durans TaxID=2202825 RepID=UPI002AFFD81C|nr:adenylate/guanylate cyclase domain-containing protein [Methylobacterium durans]MEA1832075.1 adenylate/guanylate cyclase domain-containing protein [Methylobacterium durans]